MLRILVVYPGSIINNKKEMEEEKICSLTLCGSIQIRIHNTGLFEPLIEMGYYIWALEKQRIILFFTYLRENIYSAKPP
jgi:hypothetical protein